MHPTVLLYATGGLAYGRIETDYTAGIVGSTASLSSSDSTVKTGWVVGGGVEGALDRNWLLRVDYLYMDFGRSDSLSGPPRTVTTPGPVHVDATTTAKLRSDFVSHVLRAGLSYKLN